MPKRNSSIRKIELFGTKIELFFSKKGPYIEQFHENYMEQFFLFSIHEPKFCIHVVVGSNVPPDMSKISKIFPGKNSP